MNLNGTWSSFAAGEEQAKLERKRVELQRRIAPWTKRPIEKLPPHVVSRLSFIEMMAELRDTYFNVRAAGLNDAEAFDVLVQPAQKRYRRDKVTCALVRVSPRAVAINLEEFRGRFR